MIFGLLRRDPAMRVLPIMFVAFGVLGAMGSRAVLEPGQAATPPDLQDLTVTMLLVTVWAMINYFAVGKMHEIASPFEMAMPIDARDLWAARLIAMSSTVCGGIVGYCIGFVIGNDLPLQPFQWAIGFNATAFALLIPFVYHSVRIRAPKWGIPLPVFVPLLGALIYGYARMGMTTPVPGIAALAVTAVLGATTYARLPRAFELPTAKPGNGGDSLADRVSLDGLDDVPGIGTFLAATRALRPPAWFTPTQTRLLIGLVLVLNVCALSLSPYVLMLVLVLAQFAWFARTVNGGSRLAHLPIARGRVFLHATLPGLVAGGVIVVSLVAYLPDQSWAQVFASKQVALGVAVYAFAWGFTLSLLLLAMGTPPDSASAWRLRHVTKIRYWCGLALVAIVFALYLGERARAGASRLRFWEMSDGSSVFATLAAAAPLGPAVLWGLAALCCAAAFVWLRHEFLAVETVPATDF